MHMRRLSMSVNVFRGVGVCLVVVVGGADAGADIAVIGTEAG